MAVAVLSSPEIDLDLNKVVLDVVNRKIKHLDTRIEGSIVAGEIERTMEGASTLSMTVHDPKRALLESGMFSYPIDVRLDRFFFRLVKVGKQGDELALTFEDREVANLRQHFKPRKASRAKLTRAQFALSLVREVKAHGGIPFVCPELRKRQPVAHGDVRKGKKALPFQFRRGGTDGTKEDSWTCLQRLADEVQWACFCSAGRVWFASEPQLVKAEPKLSISEDTLGVSNIDFDIDNGKVRSDATVTARARRWLAGPGNAVSLFGVGPANGKWLVSALSRGLYDAEATITLKRATQKLPEPAPEAASTPSSGGAGGRKSGGLSGAASKAYAAAQNIDGHHYPYVWGGGHGSAGTPSGGGYDCSGSTCAVLAAAGLGFRLGGPAAVSGALANWGRPGKGEALTVYANDVHVFIVFHTSSGDRHFGTGRWGKSWSGAGFNPQMHPTSGFSARHWPGT